MSTSFPGIPGGRLAAARSRDSVEERRTQTLTAIERGTAYLARFQSESGTLRGDYDGPLFLTPGYVFAHYATGTPILEAARVKLVRYLERAQNADGGFGLHLEGPSLLFSTVLNYVALRLLGSGSPQALAWIRDRGGALAIPSWGKYWLAIMRLYDWEGVNPLPPELWLLPRWVPIHPARFWCHARVIYLALSYLYGRRWQIADDDLVRAIREEIFVGTPEWSAARNLVAPGDVHVPHSPPLRALNAALCTLHPHVPRRLRARALAEVLDHVEHEERTTAFRALGPVNKALDAIVLYAAGSPLARRSIDGLDYHLFDGERGLTVSAEDSSELWDTAFAVQALAAARSATRIAGRLSTRTSDGLLVAARGALLDSQICEDVPERRRYHRDHSRGGWPFSTRAQGWPVSDCTAEALLALLALGDLERDRLVPAVDLLLGWQNPDGGWPTYERRRAGAWLELLNASELFAEIMVDRSHLEPTASCTCALVAARALVHGYRDAEIARALARAERYIRARQRTDGSWEGAWGVCFTYGTWFGVRALRALGVGVHDPSLGRAARFLLSKQLPDGGWGESWESCPRRAYIDHPDGSQPVMTAWAVLALSLAGTPQASDAIESGVRFLLGRQCEDGDWPQQGATGVFNRTCMLNYRFYRDMFPLWAIALSSGGTPSEATQRSAGH
jgi:squalene/oxidosqualene cyclase-like protein